MKNYRRIALWVALAPITGACSTDDDEPYEPPVCSIDARFSGDVELSLTRASGCDIQSKGEQPSSVANHWRFEDADPAVFISLRLNDVDASGVPDPVFGEVWVQVRDTSKLYRTDCKLPIAESGYVGDGDSRALRIRGEADCQSPAYRRELDLTYAAEAVNVEHFAFTVQFPSYLLN